MKPKDDFHSPKVSPICANIKSSKGQEEEKVSNMQKSSSSFDSVFMRKSYFDEHYIEKQKVIDALKRADNMGFELALIKWLKKELGL